MIHVTREQYLLLVVVDVWLVVAVVLPARATHTRPPAAGLARLPRLHHVSSSRGFRRRVSSSSCK